MPQQAPHKKVRSRRARVWFVTKIFAVVFAVTITAFSIWFVFGVEKYILQRLPKEVVAQNLAVSFLNQAFVLTNTQFFGTVGSACEAKLLAQAQEITGRFSLRQRRLTSLKVSGFKPEQLLLDGTCLRPNREKPALQLNQVIAPEGIQVILEDAQIPLRELGTGTVTGIAQIKENDGGLIAVTGEKFKLAGNRLSLEIGKLNLTLQRSEKGLAVETAEINAVGKINHLEKIQKLSTRKLQVLSGDGIFKFTSETRKGIWTVFVGVQLLNVTVKGEALNKMPMGFMEFKPETLWPMVEDSPGVLSFSFRTISTQERLAGTVAADLKRSLTAKVRSNLKKKIPILPF
jgi:hypothetical protein